jgi:hypothetical protein
VLLLSSDQMPSCNGYILLPLTMMATVFFRHQLTAVGNLNPCRCKRTVHSQKQFFYRSYDSSSSRRRLLVVSISPRLQPRGTTGCDEDRTASRLATLERRQEEKIKGSGLRVVAQQEGSSCSKSSTASAI